MASRDPDRTNVVLVLTDDQGCWALGCAGNQEIRTPHLDRLAATGIRCRNFFCASPVCSPARASLLTGRIPSQHGIHDWLRAGNTELESERGGRLVRYLDGQPGISDMLAAAGYTCGLSGKWHLGDAQHPQKGFTFWEAHAMGGGPYYDAPMVRDGRVYREPEYVTDAITRHGLRFLERQLGAANPFYLSLHYTAPHSPWERCHHPPELYDSYFKACAFDSVPLEPIHPQQVTGLIRRDGTNRREILSGYYAAVTALDLGVGRILDWLEDHNLRESTLVLFTSDNGMSMGHHGVYGKGNGTFPMNMYDTAVKVPTVLSCPGRVPGGRVEDALLSHYDVMPTLLDYLGLPNPTPELGPGRSFAALLRGQAWPHEEAPVVVLDEYGPVRMVRTRDWKYVHRYPDGPHELYHLAVDADERDNLAGIAQHAARQAELAGRLDTWFARYVDPAMDGARESVTGEGQLEPIRPNTDPSTRYAPMPVFLADT